MNAQPIKIGILGAHGKIGQWISALIRADAGKTLILEAEVDSGHALDPLMTSDVVIDFASVEAMLSLAQYSLACQASGTGSLPCFVIGSTGWTPAARKTIENLALKTPVLMASNFSTGVLALEEILRQAQPLLNKLGYAPVLVETHHRHKKDAPSGTALQIQKILSPDRPEEVQTHCVRAGEIIGEHQVVYYGVADQIEITHRAQDRSAFARGALDAAIWLGSEHRAGRLTPDSSSGSAVLGMERFFKARFH